jgi:hypothetical protein
MKGRGFFRFGGAVIGAWLALVFAFTSFQVIHSSLADIPLPNPSGGTLGYFFSFGMVGALLGMVVCWPNKFWKGLIAGLIAAAVLIFFLPWKDPLGPPGQAIGAEYHFFSTFAPPVVCMLLMTFMVRASINTLPDQPQSSLSPRRIALPLVATALAIFLGSFDAYPQSIQDGMRATQGFVQQGLKATNQESLPAPLQNVQGWFPNATGQYDLIWSGALDRFKGSPSLTPYTDKDFMVIIHFENGFSVSCIFGPEVPTTVCANFD